MHPCHTSTNRKFLYFMPQYLVAGGVVATTEAMAPQTEAILTRN